MTAALEDLLGVVVARQTDLGTLSDAVDVIDGKGVRIAAGVPNNATPPAADELPIAVDTTAVSGGIYVWNGTDAWVKAASI